jgi:DNA-binding beta-propeller fold protein YncE
MVGVIYLADYDGCRIVSLYSNRTQRSSWSTYNGTAPLNQSACGTRSTAASFYYPRSIALAVDSSSTLYITVQQVQDSTIVGVMVMTSTGQVKALVLNPTPRHYDSATGVAVSVQANTIYLADASNQRIYLLNITGQLVTSFTFNLTAPMYPAALALDSTEASLWVLNYTGSPGQMLVRLDASTGEVMASYNWMVPALYTSGGGSMAFDRDNTLYFIASGRLCILHNNGTQTTTHPPIPLSLNGVAYDSFNDRLIATSNDPDALFILDKSGSIVETIPGYFQPISLAISSSGAVHVAGRQYSNQDFCSITVLSPDGNVHMVMTGNSTLTPNSIAVDPSGLTPFIYASSPYGGPLSMYNAVRVLWPNGTLYSTYTLGNQSNHALQWLGMGP